MEDPPNEESDADAKGREDGPTHADEAGFTDLIREQLDEERARKASLERRAAGTITASGALVTLLLGLGALFTGREDFVLACVIQLLVAGAVVAFVVAAGFAIKANRPRGYGEPGVEAMRSLVSKDTWNQTSSPEAARKTAKAWVRIIEKARVANEEKATWLRRAMSTQVLAVAFLGGAVLAIVFAGS